MDSGAGMRVCGHTLSTSCAVNALSHPSTSYLHQNHTETTLLTSFFVLTLHQGSHLGAHFVPLGRHPHTWTPRREGKSGCMEL